MTEPARRRRGILQVFYGPESFRKLVLQPGERAVVGRGERSQLMLSRDKTLGARHFEVLWDGIVAQVRDLGAPGGIQLAGVPALRGELRNGGVLTAGDTTLRFFVEEHTPPSEPPRPKSEIDDVLSAVLPWWERGELYAVIDAARSPRALTLLDEAIDAHASLYEGSPGRALDDVAPYLVHLSARSRLLEHILREGWGQSWGIFLASKSAPKMVRRSLRRLLKVETEGTREHLYFRFYDPRVLRKFLPLTTVRQRSELLSEAEMLICEDAERGIFAFARAQIDAPTDNSIPAPEALGGG